jgi:hypothetical protein
LLFLKNDDIILIHVPKTSGSALQNIFIFNKIKHSYYHISFKTGVILSEKLINNNKSLIIITIREPFDHVLSCFYFYQEYKNFIKCPDIFEEFINDNKCKNMIVSFHTKNKLLESPVTEEEFLKVFTLFRKQNVFIFIQNYFEQSLELLKKVLYQRGINIDTSYEKSKITKRVNLNKIHPIFFKDKYYEKIRSLNEYDYKLYEYSVKKYNFNNIVEYDPIINYQRRDSVKIPKEWPLSLYIDYKHEFFINNEEKLKNILIKIPERPLTRRQYINIWLTYFFEEFKDFYVNNDYEEKTVKKICEKILKEEIDVFSKKFYYKIRTL